MWGMDPQPAEGQFTCILSPTLATGRKKRLGTVFEPFLWTV